MRVFVTGGTGHVGAQLCGALLRDGHQVTALVRTPGCARARELLRQGVRLVEGDLSDVEQVLDPGQRAIVHLACSLFPESDRRTNVDGSLNLIRAARRLDLARFVFTSSALVYSPNDPEVAIDESAPCQPTLRFARQQLEVERALLEAAEAHGFPSVILRPSEIWGSPRSVFGTTVELLRRGGLVLPARPQNLAMTELDDLVWAIRASLREPVAKGSVLNVGSPCPVSTAALYDGLASALGVAPARRLPVPTIYAAAFVSQGLSALCGTRPGFNLEIARLSALRAGPRRVDRARSMLGFEPRVYDPVPEIIASYRSAGGAV